MGHLSVFQRGEFTQMRSEDAPADDTTTTWLAKFLFGVKWWGRGTFLSCGLLLKKSALYTDTQKIIEL